MKAIFLFTAVLAVAADIKVDLKNEQVGKAPVVFEPVSRPFGLRVRPKPIQRS